MNGKDMLNLMSELDERVVADAEAAEWQGKR